MTNNNYDTDTNIPYRQRPLTNSSLAVINDRKFGTDFYDIHQFYDQLVEHDQVGQLRWYVYHDQLYWHMLTCAALVCCHVIGVKILAFTYGSNYCTQWYLTRPFMMTVTITIFVLPLQYPSRIDFLKYASFVGFVAVYYVVFFLIARNITTDYPTKGAIHWSPTVWTNVFGVIPTTCFAYQCHLSIVPIYSCLEKRNLKEFGKLLGVSMVLIVFAFTSAGTFGYLSFGTHVNQDLLLSYKPVTPDLLVATILIAGKMYTDTPILSFVGRTAVDSLYCYFAKVSEENVIRYEKRRRIVIATLWFVSALIIAILLPHVGVVISVLGGLAAVFSIFIPGLCFLQALLQGHVVSKLQIHKWRILILVAGFFIIFGAFIFVVVVVRALILDITGSPTHSNSFTNQTCT